MTRAIPLTRGQFATVDEADFEAITALTWYAGKNGYAACDLRRDGKRIRLTMHRYLLNAPAGSYVDHINGNKLDNRRENLRLCTNQENLRNAGRSKANTSGFKGVSYDKPRDKWAAYICPNGSKIFLGRFANAEAAARAYDEAALKYHGDFARLNFSKGTT